MATSDTLNSHKWDDTYFEKKKHAQEQSQRAKQGGTEEKVTSFAQHGKKTKRFCYVCGKDDHTSPICADKDKIPRSEWHVNKAHSHMQHSEQADGETGENEESAPAQTERRSGTPSRGRSATPRRGALNQFQHHANTAFQGFIGGTVKENEAFVNKQTCSSCGDFAHLRDLLILDNGSTICSMTNGEMLENVRVSKNPIMMSTNAGSKEINLEADLYGFGTVLL